MRHQERAAGSGRRTFVYCSADKDVASVVDAAGAEIATRLQAGQDGRTARWPPAPEAVILSRLCRRPSDQPGAFGARANTGSR